MARPQPVISLHCRPLMSHVHPRASGAPSRAAETPVQLLVSRKPLVGLEPLVKSVPNPFDIGLMLHWSVVVKEQDKWWVADFLPSNPTAASTVARLMLGLDTEGAVRLKNVQQPPSNCRYIASCQHNVVEEIKEFNSEWPRDLRLFRNDCKCYVEKLLHHLTGVHHVFEYIDLSSYSSPVDDGDSTL